MPRKSPSRLPTAQTAALLARYRWRLGGAAVMVAAVVLIVVLWPSVPRSRTPPPTQTRQYAAFDACLLTGSQGLADPSTGQVWDGMRDAATTAGVTVSYLPVAGPQTAGNAVPYANTLLQRHCSVIVAIGQPLVDAVNQTAPDHPNVRFVIVGGQAGSWNVTVVPDSPATRVRSSVAESIGDLAHGSVSHR